MEKNASLPFGSFNSLALFTGLCLGASPATGIAAEKSVKNSEETLVVMAPGWIRTELGGADAPLTIEETIPRLVNVLLDKRQRPGLEYLDYQGRTVPW